MKDIFGKHSVDEFHYENASNVKSNSIICGYCGNTVAPNRGYTIVFSRDHKTWMYIYKCPLCGKPIIYDTIEKTLLPGQPCGRNIKNLPDNIATLYDECRECFANHCYTASQMIARTLLMHIAVEQGAAENLSFVAYVDYLDNSGYIPPNGKAWVDFIRTSANQANHEIVIKEKEETEKVISFLSTLLLFIYELPNELKQEVSM